MKHTLTVQYEIIEHWSELNEQEQLLVQKAQEASLKAYAPYSNFLVGASVLLANGEVVTGNNQENIAYPSGLCAERVALFYVGANYPDQAVQTLVVVAKGTLVKPEDCISPCGSCRSRTWRYALSPWKTSCGVKRSSDRRMRATLTRWRLRW